MKNNYILKRSFWLVMFICGCFVTNAQVTTYTFTNATATGSNGPTQAQVTAAYAATNLSGSVVSTGGIQSFTVPSAGNYRIEAWGAAGGTQLYTPGWPGGNGAYMSGDFTFTVGTVLRIIVGQKGGDTQGTPVTNAAPGGGGGSFVYFSAANPFPYIAAGGGGGGGRDMTTLHHAVTGLNGVNAQVGGLGGVGGNGGQTNAGGSSWWAAGGAGWLTDGTGGNNAVNYSYIGGVNGAFGGRTPANGAQGGIRWNDGVDEGGDGGFGGGGGGGSANMGTAGGGGFSGGGGANSGLSGNPTGGGGGSYNGGTSQVNTNSVNPGHGKVIITRLCNITLVASANPICVGSSITLTTNAVSNYSWNNGSTASSLTDAPLVTTSYTLTAMSPSLCMTTAVITITVSSSVPSLTIANASPSVCLGNTATLTASGALTYTWTGGISNGITFTPSATQNYTISGQNGCGTSTAFATVTVGLLPVTAVANPTIVCAGNTSTLTASGATNYTWTPNPQTGNVILVSPVANTTYTLKGTSGACTNTFLFNVSVNPVPTISTSATSTMICQGQSVTLNATGALGYTWNPGGIGSSIVVSPMIPTSYAVTGNNSFGCFSTVNQVVVANPSPTVVLSGNDATICVGGNTTLSASGANSYLWSTSQTAASINVSPATNTLYTVVGTDTNTGCSDTESFNLTVFVSTIGVSPPVSICLGNSVTLVAFGASNYTWSTGDQTSNILVSPINTTVYTVNGLGSFGTMTCASTGSTTVTVNPLPVVGVADTRTNICKGESAVLTGTGASTYSWNTGPQLPSITVNPIFTTVYMVTGASSFSCINTGTIQVKVNPCTGIGELNENTKSGVQIFPNPNGGEFTISSQTPAELMLVNQLGQVVKHIHLTELNNYSIAVNNIANGIYFVVGKNNTEIIHQKIVVEK